MDTCEIRNTPELIIFKITQCKYHSSVYHKKGVLFQFCYLIKKQKVALSYFLCNSVQIPFISLLLKGVVFQFCYLIKK